MIARLTLGAGLERFIAGYVMHVSHDDHQRLKDYPKCRDRWESRDRMFRTALANYDMSDFCGSYHNVIRKSATLADKKHG